eukprot:1148355-Pelagomonas_calceolata.AAC.9
MEALCARVRCRDAGMHTHKQGIEHACTHMHTQCPATHHNSSLPFSHTNLLLCPLLLLSLRRIGPPTLEAALEVALAAARRGTEQCPGWATSKHLIVEKSPPPQLLQWRWLWASAQQVSNNCSKSTCTTGVSSSRSNAGGCGVAACAQ